MTRIAIVGGGPGGLMTAHLLERNAPPRCEITIFEATERLGGKIQTRRFDSAPVLYESGVAECYDYSDVGPDLLRSLVIDLGLTTTKTSGSTVVLDGHPLRDDEDIIRRHGRRTLEAIGSFRRRAAALMPKELWFEDSWMVNNQHPWSRRSCAELLEEVADPAARRYLEVAAKSDIATEPCFTTGLNGLKNFVMDLPGYVSQYSIDGGMEALPRALHSSLVSTQVELHAPVVRLDPADDGRYRVTCRRGREELSRDFDVVFLALPHNWLSLVKWGSSRLRRAMAEHLARYDRPGHYLRVSLLFSAPFWRERIHGSWFMLDAFGGCCVYDEGTRHDAGDRGVLGFLLAGAAALAHANLDDGTLVDRVLDALPGDLTQRARGSFVEARVHRWVGAVSGLPGGLPVRPPREAHVPEPIEHPGVFLVGDYLFDSTLNGVYDSARCATELFAEYQGAYAPRSSEAIAGRACL